MANKELSIHLIVDESSINMAASFAGLVLLSPEELSKKFFEHLEPVIVDIAEMANDDPSAELNITMAFAFLLLKKMQKKRRKTNEPNFAIVCCFSHSGRYRE